MEQDAEPVAEPLTPQKKSALRNVITVMLADCKIEPTEKKFFDDFCRRIGATQEDVKEIFARLAGSQYVVPDDPRECICQLLDMVYMMVSDGHIDHREVEVCIQVAERMGFDSSVIKTIMTFVEKGTEREQIQQYLQDSISTP